MSTMMVAFLKAVAAAGRKHKATAVYFRTIADRKLLGK